MDTGILAVEVIMEATVTQDQEATVELGRCHLERLTMIQDLTHRRPDPISPNWVCMNAGFSLKSLLTIVDFQILSNTTLPTLDQRSRSCCPS